MGREDRKGLQKRPDRLETTKRWTDEDGRVRWQGAGDLKETQAYPLQFGMVHGVEYDTWRRSGAEVTPYTSAILGITIGQAWFLSDLRDARFKWHVNAARENLKRPRSD